MNLVSIIIPCFNQAEYIDECLESVLKQTHQNWECIIVNDGSTDSSEQIIKNWSEKDHRFKYFSQSNKGVSAARNLGIKNANGDFILPLDADDYISNNYIEVCLKEIIKSEDVKLVYGKAEKFGDEKGLWDLPEFSYELLKLNNLIYCTALYRKRDFNQTDGYDENMKHGIEDWEFWLRFLKPGGKVIRNNECTFYYRIKNSSRNTDLYKDDFNVSLSYNYIFSKHRDLYEANNGIELYIKYNELKHQLNNLEHYLSKKEVLDIILKKFKHLFTK